MANRALFHAVLAVTDLIDGRRRLGGDSVFGARNALRARVCLYPAAVPDAESAVKVLLLITAMMRCC